MSETSSAYQDASRDHEPSIGSALEGGASHTPGPWSIFGEPDDAPGIEAEDVGHSVVIYGNAGDPGDGCGVHGRTSEEVWANARLIAAAPLLLEALQIMEAEKADYMIRNNLGDPASQHSNKLARAAIAAALGPQVVGDSSRDALKSGERTS